MNTLFDLFMLIGLLIAASLLSRWLWLGSTQLERIAAAIGLTYLAVIGLILLALQLMNSFYLDLALICAILMVTGVLASSLVEKKENESC